MTQVNPVSDAAVLDASVASKWYLPDESDMEQARRALDAFDRGRVAFIAPHFAYVTSSELLALHVPFVLKVGGVAGQLDVGVP